MELGDYVKLMKSLGYSPDELKELVKIKEKEIKEERERIAQAEEREAIAARDEREDQD